MSEREQSSGGQPTAAQAPEALLRALASAHGEHKLKASHVIPARSASTQPWPEWVDPQVRAAIEGTGVARLWSHQRSAADLAHGGQHTVLATGTASGKSLGFLLPALSSVAKGAQGGRPRGATALYLAPTKALAGDQLARVESWQIPGVRAATCDGDTPTDERRWIRDHANYVLTNPDMLHASLLPMHEQWRGFLRGLAYVVVDECHVYRGVFGAHVASVLRRLRRVAARYGAEPTFVLASATVADPQGHASALTGLEVAAVTDDGSPRGQVTVGMWQPDEVEQGGTVVRRSAVAEGGDLLGDLVGRDVQTLLFARSRVGTEAAASIARGHVSGSGRIAAYRGGYLPEERRVLERRLRERSLLGVAATNALELGIDVSGLEAVVVAGWPGTRASFWQQVGRAGRSGEPATALLVAADDPLDTYLVTHPESVWGAPVEATVCDPDNPHVLAPHLACAAFELPLTDADLELFGPQAASCLAALEARRLIRRRPRGWFWARPERPHEEVALRGSDTGVGLVERGTGRVVGTVDGGRAPSVAHPGAVYVHQGVTHVVTSLDLELGVAEAAVGDPGWVTQAQAEETFEILEETERQQLGPGQVCRGRVRVTGRVTSFLRRLPGGEVLGAHPLDMPEQTLVTRAVWWTVDPRHIAGASIEEDVVAGALHAAEHAAIGLMPLIATCDRWDIGGVSTECHPDTGLPTVMVYDGLPGGAGFADRGYSCIRHWLTATREAVSSCPCELGCPSCIQSPKCGNGNEPLDKAGAIRLLDLMLGSADGAA